MLRSRRAYVSWYITRLPNARLIWKKNRDKILDNTDFAAQFIYKDLTSPLFNAGISTELFYFYISKMNHLYASWVRPWQCVVRSWSRIDKLKP